MLTQNHNVSEKNTSVDSQIQDFISSPKLYLICTQKFKPDIMLRFFRPLGALSATGRKKDPVVNSVEIIFNSCLNAEKAFAIWHCRYTVPFQGRIFFSRNADPAYRETEPNSPRVQAEGFPIESSEFEIFDFFRPFGPIFSCLIEHSNKADKPIVIIHYVKPESAKSALEKLNNTLYRGKKIKVQVLSEQNALAFQSKPSPPTAVEVYRVSIKGFPVTSEISFRDFFLQAGVILNSQFDQNTGSGRVEYETAIGVFNAINKFNNFNLKGSKLIVKNIGEDSSPQPHAIIPLYSNDEIKKETIETSIPASRNASQSRWSQAAKDKPQQITSKRKQRDDSKFNIEVENKNDSALQNSNVSPKFTPKPGVQQATFNNSPKQSVSSSTSITDEKTISPNKNISGSVVKSTPHQETVFPKKDIDIESQLKVPEPTSLPNSEQIKKGLPNVSGGIFKKSWEEFKNDKPHSVISNLTKSLSPAANPIQEKMLKTIFMNNPELVNKLAQLAIEFNDKLTVEENKFKATHEFYLSNEAYHAMLRSCNESNLEINICNPEYFPLYPSKETYLNQLMSLPKEQNQPIMASMIEKRLKEMNLPEHSKVSNELVQKYSLRLLMVSYYYDDVLVDLLQKNFPGLEINQT